MALSSRAAPRPPYLAHSFRWSDATKRFVDRDAGYTFDPVTHLFREEESGQYCRWNAAARQYMQVDARGVPIEQVEQSIFG